MGFQKFGKRPPIMTPPRNYITAATTGTPMTAPGVYTVYSTASSTGTGVKNYTLAAPRLNQIGELVEINCIQATTNKAPRVTLTAASLYSTVGSTSITKDTIRFGRADQSATLRAMSTTKWKLVVAVNSPTITTS